LTLCKDELLIIQQILSISQNQGKKYSNRLDSLTFSTAQTRIENTRLRTVNIVLMKKKNASKFENWAWRIGIIVGGYFIVKK